MINTPYFTFIFVPEKEFFEKFRSKFEITVPKYTGA